MIRAKAISIMIRKVEHTMIFQNMQEKGLITPRHLTEECFTLTSAMGLGVSERWDVSMVKRVFLYRQSSSGRIMMCGLFLIRLVLSIASCTTKVGNASVVSVAPCLLRARK